MLGLEMQVKVWEGEGLKNLATVVWIRQLVFDAYRKEEACRVVLHSGPTPRGRESEERVSAARTVPESTAPRRATSDRRIMTANYWRILPVHRERDEVAAPPDCKLTGRRQIGLET
jgi:hypothetical protein